jgi:hypothetical protein
VKGDAHHRLRGYQHEHFEIKTHFSQRRFVTIVTLGHFLLLAIYQGIIFTNYIAKFRHRQVLPQTLKLRLGEWLFQVLRRLIHVFGVLEKPAGNHFL